MRFLVDAQLPRRLVRVLRGAGHEAIHTLDLPDRNRTGDHTIRSLADEQDRIVISKDADFRDSHLIRGTPRQLLQVSTGNIRNADLIALVETYLPAIVAAFDHSGHVELTRSELITHPHRIDR